VAGCLVHSDRGSQFQWRKFQHALRRHRHIGSMGRVGVAGDNAAMESFFAVLPKERPRPAPVGVAGTVAEGDRHWVERVYHRKRRQRRLAKLTPVEYELVHEKAVALAVKTPESTEPSAVPLVLSWLVSQISSEVHIITVTVVLLAINTV